MEEHVNVQDGIVNKIRILRKEKNMTQSQLAEMCNVSKSLISKLETNRATLNLDLLYTLASALDVSMPELLDEPKRYKKSAVIIRRSDRQRLISGVPGKRGYYYYRLADKPDQVDAMLLEIRRETNSFNRFVKHAGHEFISVLNGDVILYFRNEEHKLKEGDTAFFDGGLEHKILPDNCEVAQLILLYIHL